jgi:hypothetical protein
MSNLKEVNGQVPSVPTPKEPDLPPTHTATDVTTDAAINSAGDMLRPNAEARHPSGGNANRLQPASVLQTKRKVELTRAALPTQGDPQAVESLSVRVLKGVGASFTPYLNAMLTYFGLEYAPRGEFQKQYQIVDGPLLDDPRVMRHARRIAFVPVYSWSTYELSLLPVKQSIHGRRVLDDLKKLQPRFPNFQAYIEWVDNRKRHVVYSYPLTAAEQNVITAVKWPTPEEVREALCDIGYDHIDDLAQANDDIRLMLQAREVS